MVRYTQIVQKNQEERGGVDDRKTVGSIGPILFKIKEISMAKARETLKPSSER